MWSFNRSIIDIICQRYSVRSYERRAIAAEQACQLGAFMQSIQAGPLGTPIRYELAAATEQDARALKGLGTYGLIRHPAGFLIGAASPGVKNLEDFGYGMEAIILFATGLGLGTCWLGGNFTRSSFSRKIRATREEIVPAVASAGYASEGSRTHDRMRRMAKGDTRLPWEALFYQTDLTPLSVERAGACSTPLEMLRQAPSASNHQPWRVVQDGSCFHFYLQRTPNYPPGSPIFRRMGLADLQRVDIGIGMCHFDLAARELGLEGGWVVHDPLVGKPEKLGEYVVTWVINSSTSG